MRFSGKQKQFLKLFTVIGGLLAPLAVSAQPTISNATFNQESNGTGGSRVVVNYDLATTNGNSTVELQYSADGGATFAYTPITVSGDVGAGITPGTGKSIQWTISTDRPNETLATSAFRLVAEDSAALVSITNAGFEADAQADGFLSLTAPPGWSAINAGTLDGTTRVVGTLNPNTTDHYNIVSPGQQTPEGRRVGLVFLADGASTVQSGLVQTLGTNLAPNTRYRLSVAIGNIDEGTANFGYFDLRGFPGYQVNLLAGANAVAADNSSLTGLIADGDYGLSQTEVFVGNSHAGLGQPLTIELVNLNLQFPANLPGIEVNFDDVRLRVGGVASTSTGILETVPPTNGTPMVPATAAAAPIAIPFSGAADSGSGISLVELWYRTGSGNWTNSGLVVNSASGSFSFTPPGVAPSNYGNYFIQLVAQDSAGNRSTEPSGTTGTGQGTVLFDAATSVTDWKVLN